MVLKKKFQEGGPMPAEGAPQGGDPMALLIQGALQAIQSGDCNIAMQVCQMFLQLAGGGGQPAAPEEAAPAPAEGEPTYRMGGLLLYRK